MNFSNPIIKELNTKFLDSIYKAIPNNTILNKFLPNNGATTLEIKCHRHSIIIVPNVPVIEGKELKHNKDEPFNKVFGIYEGVNVEDVTAYLNSPVVYKKLITTPESFSKVKEAIELSRFNIYQDFFILFDECERIIQDSVYRKKIALPLADFFKFKKRAMISATPLPPSDPRFKKYKFKYVKVKPMFEFQKTLKLVTTNSIILSLKKYFDMHASDSYFIFLNSTDVIASIINELQIKDNSSVYCARESVYKLKINGFTNSYERLTKFTKYNFFTSRFFSAVDIELPYTPTVIMLTDTSHAFHSILDPYTESIQILGRFRNGIEQAIHISTIDSNHKPKSSDEARGYLEGCETSYNELKRLRMAATAPGSIDTLDQALRLVEYSQFVNEDGSKNYFMWDNFINEERVKGYYTSKESLIDAYKECPHFTIRESEDRFPIIETVINGLSKMVSQKLVCKHVVEALNNIYELPSKYSAEDIMYVKQQLIKNFGGIVTSYNVLGYQKMQELNFDTYKIKKVVYELNAAKDKSNFQFLDRLSLDFEVGSGYPSIIIVQVLKRIITDLKLHLKPGIKLLKEFYDLSPRTTIHRDKDKKDIKGHVILRRKFTSLSNL
jgi:hypothetical protein